MPSSEKPSKRSLPSLPPSDRATAEGHAALVDVQSRFAAAVMRPLSPDWQMQPVWTDGTPSADVMSAFIKPNDRMTSLQRLELYNRQYWYRLFDVMYEDYPGMAAILGEKRFNAFCEAYLVRHPSRSGLLRNLGRHLDTFIQKCPELTAPDTSAIFDMARFEWSQIVAFDGATRPPLTPDDLLGRDPAVTTLTLQPYITLLSFNHAVDHLLIAVKKQSLRSEASNATEGPTYTHRRRRRPKPEAVKLVVHRLQNTVFVKRLEVPAYEILRALQEKATISEAIERAIAESDSEDATWPSRIQEWFQLWMSFGWFCRK